MNKLQFGRPHLNFIKLPKQTDDSVKQNGAWKRQPHLNIVIHFSGDWCQTIPQCQRDATQKWTQSKFELNFYDKCLDCIDRAIKMFT